MPLTFYTAEEVAERETTLRTTLGDCYSHIKHGSATPHAQQEILDRIALALDWKVRHYIEAGKVPS
jgi:hypothetical protein